MEFYVKVKSTCDNCAFQCGVQLGPDEKPRWYCNKSGCKKELPKENTCKDFCFDSCILRPTVESKDILIKENKEALDLAGEYKKENEEMKRLLKLISEETDCLATFRYADEIEKLIGG